MVDKKGLDSRFYYVFTTDELSALNELISDLPKSAGKEVIQDILTKAQNEPEQILHYHYWDDGFYFPHSHKGGDKPHGHHGAKYGLPELPKINKADLQIKSDGFFDN